MNYIKGLLEAQLSLDAESNQTMMELVETTYQIKVYDNFNVYKNVVFNKIEDKKWLNELSRLDQELRDA